MSKKSQTTGMPKANRPAPRPTPSQVKGGGAKPADTPTPSAKATGTTTPASSTGTGRSTPRPPRLMRETHNRAEREAELQRLLVLITSVVGVIVVVILAIAIVYDLFVVPNQVVAEVNGETITVGEFEQRVRLERFLVASRLNTAISQYQAFGFDNATIQQQLLSQPPYSTYLNELDVPDQLGNRVVNDMVEDELVRQLAAERGVTVTQEDIQKQINQFFAYDPDEGLYTATPTVTPTVSPTPLVSPTPSPVPTSTPEPTIAPVAETTDEAEATATPTEFPTATPTNTPDATQRADTFNSNRNDYYNTVRSSANVGDAQINAYFEMLALRSKLADALAEEADRTTQFVNSRHILVATEAEANEVLAALNAGESFAALAAAVSIDESNKNQGGDLGWAPPTNYVAEFAAALRDAEIGVYVGPVQTQFGYHIIQVRGREERQMSDDDFERAKNAQLETLIEDTREAQASTITIFDTWVEFVPRT